MNAAELARALRARTRLRLDLPGYAEAAVLLPLLVDDPDAGPEASLASARLLFTVRHDDLRTHAGQISFPGGRRDASDEDLIGTALREAAEELGIPRDRVEVLGCLDDVPTPSRFIITPVVARVRGPLSLVPQATEVQATFDCALADLLGPTLYRDGGLRRWEGVEYVMHEYHVGERRIWGATARMVHDLTSMWPARAR